MRPHDSKRIIFILSGIGLAAAILNAGGGGFTVPELGQASGSVPDLPGLREREALEPGFIATFLWVVQQTGANGDRLAALISEESGFNPQALEPGDGGSGFLQWLPQYAPVSGYTADQIRAMTGIQQLVPVMNTIIKVPGYKTDPAVAGGGWNVNLSDDAVVIQGGTSAYNFFHNYDRGGKGYITAGDVRAYVYGRLNGVGRISV